MDKVEIIKFLNSEKERRNIAESNGNVDDLCSEGVAIYKKKLSLYRTCIVINIICGVILLSLMPSLSIISLLVMTLDICSYHFNKKNLNLFLDSCKIAKSSMEVQNCLIDAYQSIIDYKDGYDLDKEKISNINNLAIFCDKEVIEDIREINETYGIDIKTDASLIPIYIINCNDKDSLKKMREELVGPDTSADVKSETKENKKTWK